MRSMVVRILALILVPSAAWAQAQLSQPIPLDWIDKLIAMGPAGIMGLMWWLERAERVENAEKFANAMFETKAALQALVNMATPQGRR